MRNDQTVTIKRGGATVYRDIPAQIDRPFQKEGAEGSGMIPVMTYTIFLSPKSPIEVYAEDLIVVQKDKYAPVIDPKTNAPRQYRIASDPAYYPLNASVQIQAEKYRGT